MINLIIEPAHYVADYGYFGMSDMLIEAIEGNDLPMGMSIEYAQEVITLLNEEF
tara:strand:- start:2256 stop:2417 length:162 start_codon:yes stop_codon:yes gene_type:complete